MKGALDRARRRRAYRRLQKRMAGPRLLEAFARAYPQASFAEVGANDGEQHDHLRPFILSLQWRGVMVEPVPYVFARLQANYAELTDRITLVNAAVAREDGRLPFFHLRDADEAERATLPDWYDGIGSFSREALLSHAPQMPDIAERVVEREVEALSFDSLLARGGLDGVDLLVVDTEGFDFEILRGVDLERWQPRLVVYEHFHLAPDDRSACRAMLEAGGYQTMEEGFDTYALRPGEDPLGDVWRGLRPAIAGVSKDDEA